MGHHVLVLGGARSGKTGFAEEIAVRMGQRPLYLATAEALDDEMKARVASHKRSRAGRFDTLEVPIKLADALMASVGLHDVILVDCITLWITNLLAIEADVAMALNELVATLTEMDSTRVILVSNEVGLGIVPDNALARSFRDLTGAAHQRLAEVCAEAYFVVAGLPITLKGNIKPD